MLPHISTKCKHLPTTPTIIIIITIITITYLSHNIPSFVFSHFSLSFHGFFGYQWPPHLSTCRRVARMHVSPRGQQDPHMPR
jgi:hypothetical protein